jgi:hypothetical protein
MPVTRSRLQKNLVTTDFSILDAVDALRYAYGTQITFRPHVRCSAVPNASMTAGVHKLRSAPDPTKDSTQPSPLPEQRIPHETSASLDADRLSTNIAGLREDSNVASMFGVYNPK